MQIAELMEVRTERHDLAWLKEALQAAIELEFATIPPYLCALWSIEAEQGTAYDLIREVVIEEMLHMGLACNLLATIGGIPELNTPRAVPKYPGPLPGGIRPGLLVALQGLTRALVRDVFMQIEYPRDGPIAFELGRTFPTIGAFYDAVHDAFGVNASAITGQRQRTDPSLGLGKITSLAEAEAAILLIKVQGEGTPDSPLDQGVEGDLAHYYKFSQIDKGYELIRGPDGRWGWGTTEVQFPRAFPMAPVPPEGYPESLEFDRLYTRVLDQLHSAWANDDQSALDGAVGQMYSLAAPARELMRRPRPDGAGNLGPSFRLIR